MPKITFFAGNQCLGTYPCPGGSSQPERNDIAINNGINHYTKFVLDDGRVTGYVDNGLLMRWDQGVEALHYHSNTNLMEPSNRNMPMPPEECLPTIRKDKIRGINITQVDHGYIVAVGCQTLVFEDRDILINKLSDYLRNPEVIEKKWMLENII